MTNKLTPGGNMRWESMRMMLPEHIKALKQLKIDEQKITRPELSEDDLAGIEQALRTAAKNKSPVEIDYYKDGFIKQKIGYVQRIDPAARVLTIADAYWIRWRLAFGDVVGARGQG